jgi:hypothetical protein
LAAAAALDGDHDGQLGRARPGSAGGAAADEDLIELDVAAELLAVGPDHGPPQLVHPRPGGFVGTKSEDPLQPLRGHAIFL